ncbi:MAG: hypothetical protein ABH829_04440 [archaeon]
MRAQATIIEQFILFAAGFVLFIYIAVGFGGIQGKFFFEAQEGDLHYVSEYVALEIERAWSLMEIGHDAEVEITIGIPAPRNTLLELDGSSVCASADENRVCTKANVPASLKGKTYSLERFSIFGSGQEIRIE